MDIKILDNNYNVIKVLDTFDSLIWNTRYNDVGDFQLKCDKKQFKYMKEGYKILNMEDDEYIGNIEGLEVLTDERTKKNTFTVTGRFEESILYNRVVMKGVYSQSIEPAEFVNLLIDRNAINPEEPERVINNLVVGTKPNSIYGPIAYESVYSNLLDTIIRTMKAAEMGFKMDINIDTGARVFNMYNGLDRTQGQTSNVPVVLSKNFDNILTSEYEKYTKDYKNVVYIKGEGEFKTSLSKGAFTGVERREMFVDLTSISRTMNDGTVLNDVQYAEILQNEARDYLERAIKEELLYNSLNLQSNYKYKEDFDLGDLVTCAEADLDFSIDLRIVEINQVWDKKNGYSIYLNLGETKTNLSNYVENKMAGKLLPDTKKDINKIIDGTQVVGIANTANTANTANSAVNADTVDGKHASEFANSGHNHSLNNLSEKSYNSLTDKPTSFPANGGNADTVDGKHESDFANASHNHALNNLSEKSYNSLTNKPTSLPANGGNADTVDGKHASEFFINGDTQLYMSDGDGFIFNDITNKMYVRKDGVDYELYAKDNITSGTANPSGGSDGDIYLQYE